MNRLLNFGWLAKDEDGRTWIHPYKPTLKKSANGLNYWGCGVEATYVGKHVYPEMHWRDEPKKCHIYLEVQTTLRNDKIKSTPRF